MTVCEGDGSRNVTTWTCLMWLLKANVNIFYLRKYAIKGMYFLTLTRCLLTHQMSERHVIWTRTTRKIGANMPNNLEWEHSIKDTV